MLGRIRNQTGSNVVAYIALFFSLSGAAVAAGGTLKAADADKVDEGKHPDAWHG